MEGMIKMKAWIVTDKNEQSGVDIIVLADSSGIAKSAALKDYRLEKYSFTDLKAVRCRHLDIVGCTR